MISQKMVIKKYRPFNIEGRKFRTISNTPHEKTGEGKKKEAFALFCLQAEHPVPVHLVVL
jgi:hypothetical protein